MTSELDASRQARRAIRDERGDRHFRAPSGHPDLDRVTRRRRELLHVDDRERDRISDERIQGLCGHIALRCVRTGAERSAGALPAATDGIAEMAAHSFAMKSVRASEQYPPIRELDRDRSDPRLEREFGNFILKETQRVSPDLGQRGHSGSRGSEVGRLPIDPVVREAVLESRAPPVSARDSSPIHPPRIRALHQRTAGRVDPIMGGSGRIQTDLEGSTGILTDSRSNRLERVAVNHLASGLATKFDQDRDDPVTHSRNERLRPPGARIRRFTIRIPKGIKQLPGIHECSFD